MKILTAYFSASGVTASVAKKVADAAGSDIFEIKPSEPYTRADLDWTNKKSRSSVEMSNPAFRPEMAQTLSNVADYNVIFLGFPIWWYVAPTIVNTFLESADFSGKKIILFATSGSSGFGKTVDSLKPSVSGQTEIVEGKMLTHANDEEIAAWVKKAIG